MIDFFINISGQWQQVDLDKDVPFPITYSQADARNPESRRHNTTKTIDAPGTVNNNALFTSAYDLHISDVYNNLIGFNFDPTLRYPCYAREKGKVIFTGAANLISVKRKRRDNRFQISCYSEIIDIFQSLGDLQVSELDWSVYDHDLDVATIQASWAAATGSGYVYGLIHYGLSTNLLNYKTNQLYPYIYILEFVKKCFALSGKTLSSTFLNSVRMKKLVWGFGGGQPTLLSALEVGNRQAHYTGDGSAAYVLPVSMYEPFTGTTQWNYTKWILVSDNPNVAMTQVTDTYAQFNESTGELVVFNNGSYNLHIEGTFPVDYALTDPGLTDPIYSISVSFWIYKNMALISQNQQNILDPNPGSTTVSFDINQALDCAAGDVIFTVIKITTFVQVNDNGMGEELELDIDLDNTLVYNFTAINSGLNEGDDVQLSRMLPQMKAADLLKDVMTMFNMYMSDPDSNGVVVMEPIDKYFYETDDVDDWNEKIDRNEEVEIEPASNIEGKVYRYKWAEDRDYYKQRYFDLYGHDYGDYDYNVPSTFKKGDKVFELKQAQSCPVLIDGTDIVIPMIVKRNPTTGLDEPHKGKPRMFFYNGEIACDDWYLVTSDVSATVTTNSVYPQFHHLDDLASADYDLNFGVPVAVFYPATTYTSANMFLLHHAQAIRELTGRDSKFVNAIFKLNENDLYHNFMRRLCNIDGVLYRKNLVKDYLAGSGRKVQVELIKIVAANSRSNYAVAAPEIFKPALEGIKPPITTSQAARPEEPFIPADTTAGDVTITLPADPAIGQEFVLKKMTTANFYYIQVDGGVKTIDNAVLYRLTARYSSAVVVYDGTNYLVKSVKLA